VESDCCFSFIQFTAKKTVTKKDIYGSYTIDRSKFAGQQADWQYNHFRFEITKDQQFFFIKQIIKTLFRRITFS